MFNVNDIATYGANGVCKITQIEDKDLTGTKKTYLILNPLSNDKSTFFVPIDNPKLMGKIRKILSEKEINELIDSIPDETPLWIEIDKLRHEQFKKTISDGDRLALFKMIKGIYQTKEAREAVGKKLHSTDEHFLNDAEKILYDEFKYVLNISREEVLPYIRARIDKRS